MLPNFTELINNSIDRAYAPRPDVVSLEEDDILNAEAEEGAEIHCLESLIKRHPMKAKEMIEHLTIGELV